MQFNEIETKSDYIEYCLDNYDDILSIDTAIPVEIHRVCKELSTPTSNICTIYYKNGTSYYENIIAKATIAYKRKR